MKYVYALLFSLVFLAVAFAESDTDYDTTFNKKGEYSTPLTSLELRIGNRVQDVFDTYPNLSEQACIEMVAKEFNLSPTVVDKIFMKAAMETGGKLGTRARSDYASSSNVDDVSVGYSDAQKRDIEEISRKSGTPTIVTESQIEAVSKQSGIVTKQDLIDAQKVYYGLNDEKD